MLVKSQKLSPKIFKNNIEMLPTRNGYGDGIVALGKADKNVVVLCCDLTESTRTQTFAKTFPDRFVEVGVAEQNMTGIAVGMALEGKIPFTTSYAVFSPGRSWDQIRVSVCYNTANVKTVGAHAGISVGPDGATHQALEDIALMRVLPRMTVVVPSDYHETLKATVAAGKNTGPYYIRIARHETPVFTTPQTPFKVGRAEILWKSKQPVVGIIGCGPLLYEALLAARELGKHGIGSLVVNNHTLKPLDGKTLMSVAKQVKGLVTIEEHQVTGGLFGAVSEFFSQHHPMKIQPVAVMDRFGESGEPSELLDACGLLARDVIAAAKKALG